jgi:hypothetical protein
MAASTIVTLAPMRAMARDDVPSPSSMTVFGATLMSMIAPSAGNNLKKEGFLHPAATKPWSPKEPVAIFELPSKLSTIAALASHMQILYLPGFRTRMERSPLPQTRRSSLLPSFEQSAPP